MRSNSREQNLKFYENFTKRELDISNFIFPSVLCGLARNVYFIYPGWRNYKAKRKRFSICSAFGEGKVLKYGIKPSANSDPRIFKAFPDLKRFNYSMLQIKNVPKNRSVILDIDLDYFACVDSISNHMNYELEITKEQFLKKDLFLKDRTLPFCGFGFDFVNNGKRYYAKVAPKKVKEISYLPPKEDIESEITKLVDTLKMKGIKPKVVTICRSCNSGFCPEDLYKFIETKVKKALVDHLQECQ